MNLSPSIADLLGEARRGDAAAYDQIFRIAYDDLHALASARLRDSNGTGLLDTSSLVNESYLRFAQTGHLKAEDRLHFVNYAGRVMRSVIVDFARERLERRQGADGLQVTLDTGVADSVGVGQEQILRINQALEELEPQDERLVRVVEMRYFGGLSEEEIAASLDVHVRTVRRDWEKARSLLSEALELH